MTDNAKDTLHSESKIPQASVVRSDLIQHLMDYSEHYKEIESDKKRFFKFIDYLLQNIAITEKGMFFYSDVHERWKQVDPAFLNKKLGQHKKPLLTIQSLYQKESLTAKIIFDPSEPEMKRNQNGLITTINLWSGFTFPDSISSQSTNEKGLQEWKRLLLYSIMNKNQEYCDFFIKFISHTLRHPGYVQPQNRITFVFHGPPIILHIRALFNPLSQLLFNGEHYSLLQGKTMIEYQTTRETTKWCRNLITVIINPIPDPSKLETILYSPTLVYKYKEQGESFFINNLMRAFIVSKDFQPPSNTKFKYLIVETNSSIGKDQFDISLIQKIDPQFFYQWITNHK